MRNISTALVSQNEIAKSADFQMIADQSWQNAASLVAAVLGENSTTSIVLRGLALSPNTPAGMTVVLSPGAAVNTQGALFVLPVGTAVSMTPNPSSQIRIDSIEVVELVQPGVNLNRAFKDPVTGVVSVSPTNTQKTFSIQVNVIQGIPGNASAPASSAAGVKIGEIVVPPGATQIQVANIFPVTMTAQSAPNGQGNTNAGWTTAPGSTLLIKDLLSLKNLIRAIHDETGNLYPLAVKLGHLDLGVGANQLKASSVPLGVGLGFRGLASQATDNILQTLQSLANLLTPADDFKQMLASLLGPGIYSGLGFSLTATTANVSAGFGVTPFGDLIHVATSQTFALSGITRPPAGNQVWVSFCLQPSPAITGAQYSGPDWTALVPILGVPAVTPARPNLTGTNNLLVADVLVDSSSAWTSFVPDVSRMTPGASGIFANIKKQAGSGSGLDADKLDGMDSPRFLFGDADNHGTTFLATTDANTLTKFGLYRLGAGSANLPTGEEYHLLHFGYTTTNFGFQIAKLVADPNSSKLFCRSQNNGSWSAWVKIWNAENGGTGSGLDADKFQGLSPSAFNLFGGGGLFFAPSNTNTLPTMNVGAVYTFSLKGNNFSASTYFGWQILLPPGGTYAISAFAVRITSSFTFAEIIVPTTTSPAAGGAVLITSNLNVNEQVEGIAIIRRMS